MKKLKILLRYGLACSSLTILCGVASAQSPDESREDLPPIVQAVHEPAQGLPPIVQVQGDVPQTLPPIVQAAGSSTEPSTAYDSADVSGSDENLPPIVQAANETDRSEEETIPHEGATASQNPQQIPPFAFQATRIPWTQPLKPMWLPGSMVQTASADPESVEGNPQQIGTEVPASQLPPIYTPADVATGSAVQRNGYSAHPSALNVSPPPVTGWREPGIPSVATRATSSRQTPVQIQQGVVEQQDLPAPEPQPVGPEAASVEQYPAGTLESGFNSRGQCAHCGGAGCEHCSGAAPVMPYESEIVSSEDGDYANHAYDCCGFVTVAMHYVIVDYLNYQRNGDVVFGGNFAAVNDFDWTSGGRVLIGRRVDTMSGHEIGFLGVDPWFVETQETDAGGGLFGNLTNGAGFAASDLSAFNNATFLEQVQKTDLQSFEFNQTYWGWDVVKTLVGVRYFFFEDQLRISSANTLGEQGFYDLDIENRMFGPQIGLELFYDVGYRLSGSLVSKIGGYANVRQGQTSIQNDGAVVLNNADEESSFAISAEIGLHFHYQILPLVRARFGYDALGLFDVGTTSDNFNPVITPSTGTFYEDGDNAVFHGVFAGLEFYR